MQEQDTPKERWLPVVGWEGFYEVSDLGRVRSLDRMGPTRWKTRRLYRGRIMSLGRHRFGYPRVGLSRNGRYSYYCVHTLVLMAFVGPAPEGYECAHENGDSTNSRLSNLRWATRTANNRDKDRHGTHIQGERNPKARLTGSKVNTIRDGLGAGELPSDLAREYDVSVATISAIKHRRTWRHLL